jgi:hypothetical protein
MRLAMMTVDPLNMEEIIHGLIKNLSWITTKLKKQKIYILRKHDDKHRWNRRRSKGTDSKGKRSIDSIVYSMES